MKTIKTEECKSSRATKRGWSGMVIHPGVGDVTLVATIAHSATYRGFCHCDPNPRLPKPPISPMIALFYTRCLSCLDFFRFICPHPYWKASESNHSMITEFTFNINYFYFCTVKSSYILFFCFSWQFNLLRFLSCI